MGNTIIDQISIGQIKAKKYKLSPSSHASTDLDSASTQELRSLLHGFEKRDRGVEIGSHNYISESPKKFMRTKALKADSFLPQLSPESSELILPFSFVEYNLRKDDILISKDSNIGEVVILDKDYPDCMISGGINRLNITENKHYIFGVLKTEFFKNQLKTLASRGSTITHAKTLFLNCKIPFPNQSNSDEVIAYVSTLVKLVISKEKALIAKKQQVDTIIESELAHQKKGAHYIYHFPSISEILSKNRMDAGTYSEEFKAIEARIEKYANGHFYIDLKNIKSGSTPKKRFISEADLGLPYNWITPSHLTDLGGIAFTERIKCDNNNLNEDGLLIVNRTSRGGRGEFVGQSAFFDYARYGASHHNQGIYRVIGYQQHDLLFMGAFLNSNLMRGYRAGLTVGSKMKEIKSKQFATIPFPNFDSTIRRKIAALYYNAPFLTCGEIVTAGYGRDASAGIIQLTDDVTQLKKRITGIVEQLAAGEEIAILS